MKKSNNLALWISVAILGLVVIGIFAFSSFNAPSVTAQGTFTLEATPDIISAQINVEGREKTLAEAKEEHDKIKEDFVNSLLSKGFTEDEIVISGYNNYPEYDWTSGTQRITGYVVVSSIEIKSSDFAEISNVIDSAIESEALVSYVSFELSDEKQSGLKAEALEKAGEDARRKAEATAKGLGKSLGRLVSVSSEDYYYGGPSIAYARAEDSAGSADEAKLVIDNPRDVEVTASLRVEYKLR